MSLSKFVYLILDTLSVYRLTKLVTDDYITEEFREILRAKFPAVIDKRTKVRRASKITYLINCPWCVSIWAAAFIFTLRKISPETATYLSSILAASALTGLAANKGI